MLKRITNLIILVAILSLNTAAYASPGGLDGNGCHTCRTNCQDYGIATDTYHCHEGGSSSGAIFVPGASNESTDESSTEEPAASEPETIEPTQESQTTQSTTIDSSHTPEDQNLNEPTKTEEPVAPTSNYNTPSTSNAESVSTDDIDTEEQNEPEEETRITQELAHNEPEETNEENSSGTGAVVLLAGAGTLGYLEYKGKKVSKFMKKERKLFK